MTDYIEIPNLNNDEPLEKIPNKPGWLRIGGYGGKRYDRPVIRCNCGELMGIGDHRVHADGRVTASFYDRDGCGWHVFLKLLDYDCGEFKPALRQSSPTPEERSEP